GVRGGVVGSGGEEDGKVAGHGFEALLREWGVVGSNPRGRQLRRTAAADDPPDGELRHPLGELPPGEKGRARFGVAGRKKRVGSDDACEALGMLCDETQADEAA